MSGEETVDDLKRRLALAEASLREKAALEAALRESQERFRALATAGGNSIYRISPDWRLVYHLHSQTLASTAEPVEEWVEKHVPEEDRPRVFAAIEEAIRSESLLELEHRVKLAGGGVGWVLSRAVPLFGPDGEIVEWFGAVSDVDERRQATERQTVLLGELQHRVRNILTVVRSMFERTADMGDNLETTSNHFRGRLDALARTQVIVTRNPAGTADLEELVRDELLSVGVSDGPSLTIEGPEVALPAKTAESVGLAIHELNTNALKYGAFATPGGRLAISWEVTDRDRLAPRLELNWSEEGVSAVPLKPTRKGFGRELIEEALPYTVGALTRLEFRGGGIRCFISLPLLETGTTNA